MIAVSFGWVVCGVLGAGMIRHLFYNLIVFRIWLGRYKRDRFLFLVVSIVGPFGLISAIFLCLVYNEWGLKFGYDKNGGIK